MQTIDRQQSESFKVASGDGVSSSSECVEPMGKGFWVWADHAKGRIDLITMDWQTASAMIRRISILSRSWKRIRRSIDRLGSIAMEIWEEKGGNRVLENCENYPWLLFVLYFSEFLQYPWAYLKRQTREKKSIESCICLVKLRGIYVGSNTEVRKVN